ncbi:hypothetical protein AB0K60_29585, partial [Thermopolyspora sp. NPDC052614]|uniref:hypothetical protein n=1 Tax=Thermopolyspora sp. NPDC052614 TaxID=3155682 RepID=UPI003437E490
TAQIGDDEGAGTVFSHDQGFDNLMIAKVVPARVFRPPPHKIRTSGLKLRLRRSPGSEGRNHRRQEVLSLTGRFDAIRLLALPQHASLKRIRKAIARWT